MYVCTFHSAWVLFNIMSMTQGQLGIQSQGRHTARGSPGPLFCSPPCADRSQGAPIKQAWDSAHLQVSRALVNGFPKQPLLPETRPPMVGGSEWAGQGGLLHAVSFGFGLSLFQTLSRATLPMQKVMAKLRWYQSLL